MERSILFTYIDDARSNTNQICWNSELQESLLFFSFSNLQIGNLIQKVYGVSKIFDPQSEGYLSSSCFNLNYGVPDI